MDPVLAGIAAGLYPLAGTLCLPISGRLFDMTHRTKEILYAQNFLQIIGNLIYAIPYSVIFIFAGRLIAGCILNQNLQNIDHTNVHKLAIDVVIKDGFRILS